MAGYLKRLQPEAYRGQACVHWTLCVDGRKTGWLGERAHHCLREILLHTLARYRLACPTYCLMPDHLHCLWIGWAVGSDQRNAMRFFRTYSASALAPWRWQEQAYDHVLRDDEKERHALASICHYVRENPVRKHLVQRSQDYPFSGALIPGMPLLDPRIEVFQELFWRGYNQLSQSGTT